MRHLSQESHARAATRACQGWSTTQPRVGREKRYAHTTTRNYSRRSDVVIPYDARLWKYKSAAATNRSNWQILPDVAAQRRLGFCEV